MSGFDKPIEETNRHRSQEVPTPRIERDKKGKEEFAELPESNTNILNAAILIYLNSLFETCHQLLASKERETVQHQLLEDLETFKNLLQQLGLKDQSKHPKFAKQLATLWHKIEQDFNFIKFLGSTAPETLVKLKKIIESIADYPPNEEHTFGFYLREHAGEEWLPFPYIEILSGLHKEYRRAPPASRITQWIAEIDSFLHLL